MLQKFVTLSKHVNPGFWRFLRGFKQIKASFLGFQSETGAHVPKTRNSPYLSWLAPVYNMYLNFLTAETGLTKR